jgi:hypothetical protein
VERGNLQPGNLQQQEQSKLVIEPKTIRDDDKFEVEIREMVRIRPQDFKALKDSFEEWRNKWEK